MDLRVTEHSERLRSTFVRVRSTHCPACGVTCDNPVAVNRQTGCEEVRPIISAAEARFGFFCSRCRYSPIELSLEGVRPGEESRTVSLPGMATAPLPLDRHPRNLEHEARKRLLR